MDNNQNLQGGQNNWNFNLSNQPGLATKPVTQTFFASVFSWMGVALGISALTAYVFGTDASYMQYLMKPEGGLSGLGYLVMFAPLGLVLLMSMGINKLSSATMIG